MKYLYLNLIFFFSTFSTFSQITVDINSGDPAFPFPQFLAYESENHFLGNLATTNPVGVTHAEMEQTIRDAWQIMANRFIYDGTTYAGVDYIQSNIGCPYDCSEGVGYAMIAAAYMADKTTFDGIWFREHDFRLIKHPRYIDGVVPNPDYPFGDNVLSDFRGDSATDGSVDIALGLLMAWKQWGDDSGYIAANGVAISYKQEALNVIRGLVEIQNQGFGDCQTVSGVIGLDGYIKGGNTWGELTDWASNQIICPQFEGPIAQHIDYAAPGYFKAFAEFLEREGSSEEDIIWNIPQLQRAEASSDWLMGKMLNNNTTLPLAGWVELDEGNEPIYSNFSDGEDFRNPWRTVLNYVWHGNPTNTWNPITHQVEAGGNSFEKNIGTRLASFMTDSTQAPWSNDCTSLETSMLTYNGPSQLKAFYDTNTGRELSTLPLNWLSGAGSPSAVAAQDYDLMAKLYRQCAIEWDVRSEGDGYLSSVPKYFHGFFRFIGMLTLSGNQHSPASITLESNLKVYHSVDKTFATLGDEIEYTISYRNYASIDGEGVALSAEIPNGMSFVSATNNGAISGNTVIWDVGTVSGFKTETGIASTLGEVKMILKVENETENRICNVINITTTNGKGWTSNEYPNQETSVMQRNCIDIIKANLSISKSVNVDSVNPGDQLVYTVDFENNSSVSVLNGGRQGVNFTYAHGGHEETSASSDIKVRLYHGADEPYIDYGNYRISMFLNTNATNCISNESDCPNVGWDIDSLIYEGGDYLDIKLDNEILTEGSDENGAWNQRLIIQFSEYLATTTPHLSRFNGLRGRVHLGGFQPLRMVSLLHLNTWAPVDWSDDWSWNPGASDTDGGLFYPVTNDWANPNNPNLPVTMFQNEACETSVNTVNNILIEEWDGYTWRRIFGDRPDAGKDIENVEVTEVLPEGFTFVGFLQNDNDLSDSITVLGEEVTYNEFTKTITWNKSKMSAKEKGNFSYVVIADFSENASCPKGNETINTPVAITSDNKILREAFANVTVSCDQVLSNIEFETSIGSVVLHPNPTVDFIKITGLTKVEKYIIYDSLGKKVLSGDVFLNETISLENLESGLYFFKLVNHNTETRKFVKN